MRLAQQPDSDAIAAFYRANATHLQRFAPVSEHATSPDFWPREIDQRVQDYANGVGCKTFFFDSADERSVIGAANLHPIMRGSFQAGYLGYSIEAAKEGKGLMQEGLRLLISFAFGPMGLHRIMANYMPANKRSAALLGRLGFVKEGFAQRYLCINGVWEDHVLTALVKRD